jgi:rhodanese-related sulfurtransferase
MPSVSPLETYTNAMGFEAIKRGLSQKNEKRKLCHKADRLARGYGPCPLRRVNPSAPERGGSTAPGDAVVQQEAEAAFSCFDRAWRMLLPDERKPRRRGGIGLGFTAGLGITMTSVDDTVLAAAQKRGVELGLPYYGAVTPTEARTLLGAFPNARLIDVRTRPEWDYVGRVPGSILIEWTTYPTGARNPQFLDQLRVAAPDPDAPLLFLCRSGQRSDAAARAAAAAGYTKAFNMLEGFEGPKDSDGHRGTLSGWRKAGLPWVQG